MIADAQSQPNPAAPDKAELTQDGFLDRRFTLLQPKKGLRAGSDALFLAASISAKPGQRVLEAGVGTGAAALALLTRVADMSVTGVEKYPFHADLARRNAELNHKTDRLEIIEGDILALKGADFGPPFDHALANPPYYAPEHSRASETASRQAAHFMPPGLLADWVTTLSRLTKPGGTVSFIHRCDAAPELLAAMAASLGGLLVLPLAPKDGAPSTRIIVRGTKGSKAPLQLLSPLALHEGAGAHTCQSDAVLRACQALDLDRMASGA